MCYNGKNWVSIHASVKDATGISWYTHAFYGCFNPRICKRCDPYTVHNTLFLYCFNPRICKRCDQSPVFQIYDFVCFNPRICKRCDRRGEIYQMSVSVSIHASVKDATDNHSKRGTTTRVSIHASVKDATEGGFKQIQGRGFNPRICKRCDANYQSNEYDNYLFQSTHL
mgnify:FL=1